MYVTLLKIFSIVIQLIASIQADYQLYATDVFGNLYLSYYNTLSKYDKNGKFLHTTTFNSIGDITAIDSSNPFFTILFFRDSQVLVLCDNNLSIIEKPIYLENYKIRNSFLVCSASNSGFWILNEFANEIVKYDKNLRTKQCIIKDIFDFSGTKAIVESKNCLIVVSELCLYIYSEAGRYIKTIELGKHLFVSVRKENLEYYDVVKQQLVRMNFLTDSIQSFDFKYFNSLIDCISEADRLFIFDKSRIDIFEK